MGTLELLLLSLGVAMDAFAASVCKGLLAARAVQSQNDESGWANSHSVGRFTIQPTTQVSNLAGG